MNQISKKEKEMFDNNYRTISHNEKVSGSELKVRQLCNTAIKRCTRKVAEDSFDGKFEVSMMLSDVNNFPRIIEERYYDFELANKVLAFEKTFNCKVDRFFQDLTDYYKIHVSFRKD